MTTNIFNDVISDIQRRTDLDEAVKAQLLQNVARLKETKVNVLITGATGAGKSSTINALFNTETAKVGRGVDPETMDIKKFELNNLILWDSPGLGDGKEKDLQHAKGIINKLLEKDASGNLLIDLVLVILDGSTRDLGTSYELINNVIIPNLGEDKSRLLIAINQADVAMKGKHWNSAKNEPEPELIRFLDEKVQSVQARIKEATGVNTTPIYYSAGDVAEGQKPYNLSKLLTFILRHTKKEKRIAFAPNINQKKEMWEKDDRLQDYQKEVEKSLLESFVDGVKAVGNAVIEVVSTVSKVASTIGSALRSFFSW